MSTGAYVGINGIARNVKKIYVGIPASYTPVEYIESSGTQYIDTGIVRDITKVFRFVASVKWNDVSTRQCIGAQGYVYFGVSGGKYQIAQGGTTTTNVTAATGSLADIDLTFNCPSSTCTGTVNNTSIGTISATYQNSPTDAHIHLFSLNDLVFPCSVQIASFKIYQNNVLVRDFIPVLDENNVPCLYDKVESKFYYNKGTGSFTYGTAGTPVALGSFARKVKKAYVGVPVSYTPIEYIESSGTQYIDTGIPASATIKTLCDMSTSTGGYPFGVTPSQNAKYYGANVSITNQRIQSYFGTTNNYTFVENIWARGQRFVLTANDNYKFYKDSTQIADYATGTTKEFDSSLPITIFALNGLYLSSRITMKLYGFKMYDNGTLVRDFAPVLDDNNIACLYEKVEGKFYYNAGTGTFTAGSTTGEPVVVGSVARLCFKGTTIWEAFIELCRANPTKSAASRVLQYQTQIENLMTRNGKDVNSYHSIYAYTDGSSFKVYFIVPTTYWYKYNEKVSGNTYDFYISGQSGSQSVNWLSASDIRYGANASSVDYSNNVIGVFSKASSGGSPSADCVVEVMSE